MQNASYDRAKALFAHAKSTGEWDHAAFRTWIEGAILNDWSLLEQAWQGEYCPEIFSWSILKEGIEVFSERLHVPPLQTLGAFLYPASHRLGYEGFWLDWQEQNVKKSVYRAGQRWMERSYTDLEEQSWILLHLAVGSESLAQWRAAPEQCVRSLNWEKGMHALNACDAKVLTLADIERIPVKEVSPAVEKIFHNTLVGTMVRCYTANWRTVGRCIETHAGPGLWLQYVYGALPASMPIRRTRAWENMPLDGVDAWALDQHAWPAASFEKSLDRLGGYQPVRQHIQWAHQWWTMCVLGMDYAQALSMARSIRSPVRTEMPLVGLDHALFSNE